jgi:hypothetical protein
VRDFELNLKSGRPAPRFYGSRVSNVQVSRPLAGIIVGKTPGSGDESSAEGVIGLLLRPWVAIQDAERIVQFRFRFGPCVRGGA